MRIVSRGPTTASSSSGARPQWTDDHEVSVSGRRAAYLSAEYLMGRAVYNNLFNMGVLKRNEDFVCEDEAEEEEEPENPLEEQAGESGNEFFDTPVQRIEERFTLPPSAESARRPVLLKPDSLKKVIAQFERKIATRFTYEPEDRKITYTEALVRQARQYRLCVEGSADSYVPLALQ